MAEQTLSIPTIILAGLIGVLVIRYFLTPSQQSTPTPAGASRASINNATGSRGWRGNAPSVDQTRRLQEQAAIVLGMFPQVDRRDVLYDLTRNGSNVAATTERILQNGVLPRAPASYRPPSPPPQPAQAPAPAQPAPKSKYPDLIQRYNLESKPSNTSTSSSSSSAVTEEQSGGKGFTNARWSANKEERKELLRKRQTEMILKARQKMLEKEGAKQS